VEADGLERFSGTRNGRCLEGLVWKVRCQKVRCQEPFHEPAPPKDNVKPRERLSEMPCGLLARDGP